ncbi:MAG TPA: DUF3052 family protein [Candidatus Dormibacteraeota bacterium]|jgi:hypothetical protein|nr:DUF3052 family protein [Candidatus Dormibacteraeota bacterium]
MPAGDDRPAKPLIDKLGVAPGARVAVVGSIDAPLLVQIRERASTLTHGAPRAECDMVIYVADVPADLLRLPALRRRLASSGAIWVATPRGRTDLQDVHVIDAARRAGLVDNKVVRFSDTHTALRLVVPRSLR